MPNLPATQFATRLALLLCNASKRAVQDIQSVDGYVTIHPWLLEQEVLSILSERTFLEALIGAPEMGFGLPVSQNPKYYSPQERDDAEAAALAWRDGVLKSPRSTSRQFHTNKVHDLLINLVAAGRDIRSVDLERVSDPPRPLDIVPSPLRHTASALARLREDPGNDPQLGGWARRNIGPLQMRANDAALEVVDSMSVWQAVMCLPPESRERTLAEIDATVVAVRQAIENANRHWGWLKRLRLSPPDWMVHEVWEEEKRFDRLNSNQAREAVKYRIEAERIAAERGDDAPSQRDFEAAWTTKPVSRKLTFAQFLETPAGKAIVASTKFRSQSTDDVDQFGPTEEDKAREEKRRDDADIERVLAELRDDGDLEGWEWKLAHAIFNGLSLVELHADDAETRNRFPDLEALQQEVSHLFQKIKGLLHAP